MGMKLTSAKKKNIYIDDGALHDVNSACVYMYVCFYIYIHIHTSTHTYT